MRVRATDGRRRSRAVGAQCASRTTSDAAAATDSDVQNPSRRRSRRPNIKGSRTSSTQGPKSRSTMTASAGCHPGGRFAGRRWLCINVNMMLHREQILRPSLHRRRRPAEHLPRLIGAAQVSWLGCVRRRDVDLGECSQLPKRPLCGDTGTHWGYFPADDGSGRDAGGLSLVEPVEQRGRDQIVGAQRLGHRDTKGGSGFGDPVGDAAVGQEPRGDDQTARASIAAGASPPRRRSGAVRWRTPPRRPPSACRPRSAGGQRGGAGVGGLVRRAHRHDDDSEVLLIGRHACFGQALPSNVISAGSSPRTSAWRTTRAGRSITAGKVDPGVVRVGQQHRHHHRRAVARARRR